VISGSRDCPIESPAFSRRQTIFRVIGTRSGNLFRSSVLPRKAASFRIPGTSQLTTREQLGRSKRPSSAAPKVETVVSRPVPVLWTQVKENWVSCLPAKANELGVK
jgi:hypothetical protein